MHESNFAKELGNFVSKMKGDNPELVMAARIRQAWFRAVDDQVASHTQAVYVVPNKNSSEVVIYVDENLWTTEMSMRGEMLRMQLNVALEQIRREVDDIEPVEDEFALFNFQDIEQVKRLRFMTSKEKYKRRARMSTTAEQIADETGDRVEPVSLDPEEENALMEAVSHIEDEGLRSAFFEAAKTDMEWKKGQKVAEKA